jgi:hypothetical protein
VNLDWHSVPHDSGILRGNKVYSFDHSATVIGPISHALRKMKLSAPVETHFGWTDWCTLYWSWSFFETSLFLIVTEISTVLFEILAFYYVPVRNERILLWSMQGRLLPNPSQLVPCPLPVILPFRSTMIRSSLRCKMHHRINHIRKVQINFVQRSFCQ